jgi:phosphopantetheine adenylyltransferase
MMIKRVPIPIYIQTSIASLVLEEVRKADANEFISSFQNVTVCAMTDILLKLVDSQVGACVLAQTLRRYSLIFTLVLVGKR